ncbi:MAG TPA: hypothetical protein VIN08_12020 [Ohtaekwangia sp.]|uniref:hypothetical protein n=1 Tax=Ohtaekwangia sp. TaxID=2066019 RepID=UPI002F9401DE
MKTFNHIRSYVIAFVIFFLLASIVFSSFNSFSLTPKTRALAYSSKSRTHTQSCSQFPYEEKEKEEEKGIDNTNAHHHFLFSSPIDESDLYTRTETYEYNFYHAPSICGITACTPLYLAKRAILI